MKIYHNNNCSKSCSVLDIIKQNGIQPEVKEYINEPPTHIELQELLKLLGLTPLELIRQKEPLFQEKFLNKRFTDAQWIDIMVQNPILIERPIVISGSKAVIARPIERIFELINK